jgi:putative addiction module antidote
MNKPAPLSRQLKLIKIGNSAGVILPKDVLEQLNVSVGDSLSVHNTPEGITLATRTDDFEAQMADARKIMKDYRNALRELAK